jgi:pimeloyl-ACP methyl ester carboxylesterase
MTARSAEIANVCRKSKTRAVSQCRQCFSGAACASRRDARRRVGWCLRTDLRPLLPQLDLPTLLINGKQSVVPYEVGHWLEEHLPNAQRVLDQAGHGPFWDDPAGFNRAVRDFNALPRGKDR